MKLEDLKKDKKLSFYDSSNYHFDFPRIPTGIFPVDFTLGGGVPANVTSSFYGHPGSFKSGITTLLLGSAQNICWNCFEYLWDCECGKTTPKKSVIVQTEIFDLEWAKALGVDLEELVITEPATGEEAVDVIYNCLQAEDCGLVVLDSLSRVIPEQEIVSPALEMQVGNRAKLHARLLNKVKSSLIKQRRESQNLAFTATNQIRANIGSFYGGEETTGGFASKHDWHLAMRMSHNKTESKFVDPETEMAIYDKFVGSVVSPGSKRKLFTMAGKCVFYVTMKDHDYPKGTVYDFTTTYKYGELILDKSSWKFPWEKDGFKTKTEMMEYWVNNPQYYLSLKKKIIDHYVKAQKGQTE